MTLPVSRSPADRTSSGRTEEIRVVWALHLHQVHALEAAQATFGDAPPRDRAVRGHLHLHGELPRVLVDALARARREGSRAA